MPLDKRPVSNVLCCAVLALALPLSDVVVLVVVGKETFHYPGLNVTRNLSGKQRQMKAT